MVLETLVTSPFQAFLVKGKLFHDNCSIKLYLERDFPAEIKGDIPGGVVLVNADFKKLSLSI